MRTTPETLIVRELTNLPGCHSGSPPLFHTTGGRC